MREQGSERLVSTNEGESNVFWPDVDKDTEQSMLRNLFTIAVARGMLTVDRIERFLSEIQAMNGTGGPPRKNAFDFESAMRGLLDMDDTLSPLCVKMFGRSLLPDHARRRLAEDLETCRRGSHPFCYDS